MLQPVSDSDFKAKVLDAAGDVIVDFWAPWCGPCRQIQPILRQLDADREDLAIVGINVDENPATAGNYGVMSIPTIIRFRDGKEVARVVGALPKAQLLAQLGL